MVPILCSASEAVKPSLIPRLRTKPHQRLMRLTDPRYLGMQSPEVRSLADQPFVTSLPVPNKDECTMAFLAHLLQVFTGFIAPLIIYCIKQDSRFVKFHALQSLIWQLCYMVMVFGGVAIFFIVMFATAFQATTGGHHANEPPPVFILFFPLIWLLVMFGWVANLILGIVYGIKANQGEWAGYPIIGKWFLPKLDASAAPAQPWAP